MSVVGAFYYLRVIRLMYFDAPPAVYPPPQHSAGVRAALGLNALAVLGLGVVPAPLLDLCARLIQ
jgi:NADH-quinone oxidoreductase subunit N